MTRSIETYENRQFGNGAIVLPRRIVLGNWKTPFGESKSLATHARDWDANMEGLYRMISFSSTEDMRVHQLEATLWFFLDMPRFHDPGHLIVAQTKMQSFV